MTPRTLRPMPTPIARLALPAVVVFACMSAACGDGRSEVTAPAAPSPTTLAGPAVPADASSGPNASQAAGSLPMEMSGPSDIPFPPRNEPLDFRTQLETKYRDGLRRQAGQSFVDIEGSIVWTQEYLRYRLNGCTHLDAVQKVLAQIDGRGILPTCGFESFGFPPRDQPFDFRQQLEAKYRDGLRRSASSTFVDTEGDIVWTQEYLRYRVTGCGHQTAVTKVFDQIDGKGIQPACGLVDSDTIDGGIAYTYTFSINGPYRFTLAWENSDLDLRLLLGDAATCPSLSSSSCQVFFITFGGALGRTSFTYNGTGRTYKLWVVNLGSRATRYSLSVVPVNAGLSLTGVKRAKTSESGALTPEALDSRSMAPQVER